MSFYSTTPRAARRAKFYQLNDALDSAPAEFDPAACPIIARHFFGVVPFRPIGPGKHARARVDVQTATTSSLPAGIPAMSAAPVTIETLVTAEHSDRQLELVREHWGAVRHLWLDSTDAARVKSDLPEDFLLGVGMPGIADIKPADDGRFEFTEDGLTALIIPAYDTIPGNLDADPEAHLEHLVDLVAVDVDQPDHFWRRRGEALVLGSVYLEIAGQEGEPVPVFSTPMSWLRSGGAGVAVLDWEWVPDLLLGHELIAEDVALGTRLEAALAPSILVMEAA